MKLLPLMTKVVVTDSPYQDVPVGQEGFIDTYKDDGYAVTITKHYSSAVHNEKSKLQERTMFFKRDQVQEKIVE